MFKDEYYLTVEDLSSSVMKKKDVATEERALEIIKDWYISEIRHFWNKEDDNNDTEKRRVEIYGREIEENKIAFIVSVLKDKISEKGYDPNEIINAWKRKGYLDYEKNRKTKKVRINNKPVNCIVVNFKDDDDDIEEDLEEMEMPF